jgi:hypothetical protein
MRYLRTLLILTAAFGIESLSAAPVLAQSLPGMGGGSNSLSGMAGSMMGNGGAGGMMGGTLPSLSSASTSNVAGVLSYCVQNNIVQGASATSALSALTGQSGVTSSSGYTEGTQGDIQSGNGSMFSLNGLNEQLKTKACNMVLQHAQSLL